MNEPKERPEPKDADDGTIPAADRGSVPAEGEVETGDGTGAIDDVDRAPADEDGRETATADDERREAAADLLSPAMPPAGAGLMIESDPRLDDRSETEKTLERGD